MPSKKRALQRVLFSALLLPLMAGAAPMYKLTPLGSIGGGSGDLHDVNNAGQVVGYALSKTNVVSAYVSLDGVSTSLQPAGASASAASGINDAGLVTGYVTSAGVKQAVLFSNGKITKLGSLGGAGADSNGIAINIEGQVAGTSDMADGRTHHAFRYTGGDPMLDLGTLGGANSVGNGINKAGHVVGQSEIDASGEAHAFRHADGVMLDLGTLGGRSSSATAINDKGLIAGFSYTASGDNAHAFTWANGTMKDLNTLGGQNSFAYGLNNLGQVVGSSETADGEALHAFIYSNGVMTDLNSLIAPDSEYILRYASDINDRGQIAALGCNVLVTSCQGFLLTLNPVPEPETYAMLLAGVAVVGWTARRRRLKLRAALTVA